MMTVGAQDYENIEELNDTPMTMAFSLLNVTQDLSFGTLASFVCS